ncbi:MAG TPA: OsmC family protein [Puia sp.]|nr:OsmC family protein [Puia sp.]
MEKEHHYSSSLTWTGNKGEGTANYKAYDRDYTIQVKGKPDIAGSSDPSFRGSPSRYNPEELLLSSISSCHMLWYLHLCSVNKIVVTDYQDQAQGIMAELPDGSGYFKEVTLHPIVTLAVATAPTSGALTGSALIERATALHHEANKMCFIANSCNFPIRHNPGFRTV